MISVTPLFSGSKGNCTLVRTSRATILIDVGYNYNSVVAELAELGVQPQDVDAILITHEHSDHVGNLATWLKNTPTPVYLHEKLADYVSMRTLCSGFVQFNKPFAIGDVDVDFFVCSHDSHFCCGYKFTNNGTSIAMVTDTGVVTDSLVQFLTPCRTVVIESNHDVTLLNNGSYPYPLKRRILSDSGHLSNSQASQLIEQLVTCNTVNVVLAHLSENNNTPELAFMSAVEACTKHNLVEGRDVKIYVASQYHRGDTVE